MPDDCVDEAAGASSICMASAFEMGAGLPLRVRDRLRLRAYGRSLCVHRESSRDRLRLCCGRAGQAAKREAGVGVE
jgi:hypothetical protein